MSEKRLTDYEKAFGSNLSSYANQASWWSTPFESPRISDGV